MRIHLLSLPHLPAKQTKGKELFVDYSQSHVVILKDYLVRELFVDYSQSHVVISKDYLVSLKKKTMDKAATNETK
jgi:hypothetical protein